MVESFLPQQLSNVKAAAEAVAPGVGVCMPPDIFSDQYFPLVPNISFLEGRGRFLTE